MASLADPVVQELLQGRRIASLATANADGSIHQTAVWYLFSGDKLYVATSSRTRKTRNIERQPNASLMVDCRDPLASRGASVSGDVRVLRGDAAHDWNLRIHRRYMSDEALADSRIGPVFAGFDDVTLELTPRSVMSWDMRELDRAVLGGAMSTPGYLLQLER
jgi:PPOX class probable F420-dependent enzyme